QKNIDPSDPSVAIFIPDICYGIDPEQTIDIYLPANRSCAATKLLAIIHGGGFNSGSKTDLNVYINAIQQQLHDYAFFNVDYRMATSRETILPTQDNAVNAAVKFIL